MKNVRNTIEIVKYNTSAILNFFLINRTLINSPTKKNQAILYCSSLKIKKYLLPLGTGVDFGELLKYKEVQQHPHCLNSRMAHVFHVERGLGVLVGFRVALQFPSSVVF